MLRTEVVHGSGSAILRALILGGQDGLVNVLGIVLAVATATNDIRVILISGLAATFAESISMAAVAYTSQKAAKEYYEKQLAVEQQEIMEKPEIEREEIRKIFSNKGFRGDLLKKIVQHITKDKKLWLETMMTDELGLSKEEFAYPIRDAWVVGVSAIIGSVIPLIPFLLFDITTAFWATLVFSTIVLFVSGAAKAKFTKINPLKSGAEMAIVGMTAAIAGYLIGAALGALPA